IKYYSRFSGLLISELRSNSHSGDTESTLGNEAEPDKDNFLEEVLEKEIELGKDNFSEKVLENEVELGEDNFSEVLENEVEWGDDDDSELKWTDDALLVKQKRSMYMKGKTPKSTYYDKYGPSGSFTKAAEGSSKITQFFPKKSQESNNLPSDWREVLDNSDDSDIEWETQGIEVLKNDIITNQNKMSILEYNKKRAIFEYLNRLDNKGRGKMNASIEAAKIIFIEGNPGKSRIIRRWASFWLKNNKLPVSRQGKHQKTIRIIDDEDIAEKCHMWIGTITPLKFKNFVEQKLLVENGITKKKDISVKSATRKMPRPTKSKSSYKNQIRNPDGTFYSRKLNKGKEIESTLGNVAELDNDNFLGEVLENEVELGEDNFSEVLENEVEWGDDDDSGWEEDIEQERKFFKKIIEKPIELKWTDDALLIKQKRDVYMKGKTPKFTYYDKYGPSGSFTKGTEGSSKITLFFPKKSHNSNDLPSDWKEVLDNSDDSDIEWETQDLFN
ncbi:13432_t:CDS:2, partial [Entrophospora sp. SA101]